MRVMVLGKATKDTEAGVMPSAEAWEAMAQFQEELVKAGIVIAGEGLMPSSMGVRIRFAGKESIVTEGPFTETKEIVAGYSIWEVKSMEEAVDWVKRYRCSRIPKLKFALFSRTRRTKLARSNLEPRGKC